MGQEAEALEEVVVKARKDNESDTEHDVVHVPVRPIPGYFTKHHTNLQQNGIIFQKLEKIRDYFPKLRKMGLARHIAGIGLVNVIGMEMSGL